jgi:predicted AAA+ superfamily ATPase
MKPRLWRDHIATLIDRDLRLIVQTSVRFESIYKLLVILANHVGLPLDLSSISREVRISRLTLRKLITAFENMFLIRIIPCEGGISTPRIFFEDAGMASYLSESKMGREYRIKQAFYQCVRCWFHYSTESRFEFFQYQTRGGAQVDLAVRMGSQITGWIICTGEPIGQSHIASAKSFLDHYGSKAQVMIVGSDLPYQEIEKNILSGPMLNLI